MGLWDGIANGINNVAKATGLNKVLDFTTVAFNHPIATTTAISQGGNAYNNLVTKEFSKPLSQQVTGTLLSTAGYAATIIGAGAVAGAAKAGTLGTTALSVTKSLIPKTVVGKVITATAAPIIATSIVSHPIQSLQTGGKAVNAYKDVLSLAANPSVSSGIDYAKEHPVATAAAVGGLALAAGGLVSTLVNYSNTRAVKENTEATLKGSTQEIITTATPTITSQLPERVITILPSQVQGNLPTGSAISSEVSAPVGGSGSKKTTKKKKKSTTNKKKKKTTKKKTAKKKVYKHKKTTKHKKKKKKK